MSRKLVPMVATNIETGEIRRFPSVKDTAEFLCVKPCRVTQAAVMDSECKGWMLKKAFVATPTIVFDFDGVIHSYSRGWKGAAVIPDPPVPGIAKAIEDIRARGYSVVVVSTRCTTSEGKRAIWRYLREHGIYVDDVRKEKPPALVYIDDRAICFDGRPETLLDKIVEFKPWNKEA